MARERWRAYAAGSEVDHFADFCKTYPVAPISAATRREAAAILRRIVDALHPPASVATYVRGYADGLDERRP